MVATLKPIQAQILGGTLFELLNGELSDETIAAVDSIKRADVPEPLNNMVGMMHGMSTMPELRQDIINMLIDEIHIAAIEMLEKRQPERTAIGIGWIMMHGLLEILLKGPHPEALVQGVDKDMLPPIERVPEWAKPLIERAQKSNAEPKELTIEMLDELEHIIQRRRAELTK